MIQGQCCKNESMVRKYEHEIYIGSKRVSETQVAVIPIEEDRLGIVDLDVEMGRLIQDGLHRHEVAVEAPSPDLHGLVWYAWVPELGPGNRVVRRIEVETYCSPPVMMRIRPDDS